MRILDTVALVSFLDGSHPLHSEAVKHVRAVTEDDETFIPSTVLIELDVVMKNNQFSFTERRASFEELAKVLPRDKILSTSAQVQRKAIEFDGIARWKSHYFDCMVAAFASENGAVVVTTDLQIPSLGVVTVW